MFESMGDTLRAIGIRVAKLSVDVHLDRGDRVIAVIHVLETHMQQVLFGAARSLARPLRVGIDELAHAGWWYAAKLLERAGYDNGILVD